MAKTVELPSDRLLGETYKGAGKVDTMYWERLADMPLEEICAGKGARAVNKGAIALEFLGKEIFCHVEGRCLKDTEGNTLDDYQTTLIVLFYLLSRPSSPPSGKPCEPLGKMISEYQLPNGDVFFRGHHVLPKASLEKAFGSEPEKFLAAGQRLGGSPLRKGDASFSLRVLPCVGMHFYLYRADDEFPAKVTILFSESIAQYMALDVIWALTNVVVKRLIEARAC